MKKIFRQKLLSVLITIALFCVIVFSVLLTVNNKKVSASSDLESEYFVGETIDLPKKTITVNTGVAVINVDAETILRYPSGKANSKNSQTLTESGVYSVEYRAKVNGKYYSEYQSFTVYDKIVDVEGRGSVEYSNELGGLKVNLSAGDVVKFNKRYDFNSISTEDNLFAFYIISSAKASRDFETLTITFTDSLNSDETMSIRFNASDGFGQFETGSYNTYVSAKFNDEQYVGIDNVPMIRKGGLYGRPIRLSFSNQPYNDSDTDIAFVKYNSILNQLYAYGTASSSYGGIVCDFSSDEFFNKKFNGFTSGEVYVSIKGDGFITDTACVVITDLLNQDLSEENIIRDNIKPELKINYGDYSEDFIPSAYVNSPYKIFDFDVYDSLSNIKKTSVNVYGNYYTEGGRYNLNIKDGFFTPKVEGNYVIEYTAEDCFNNVGKKTITVNAVKEGLPLDIKVSSFPIYNQGEKISLPDIEISDGSIFGNIDYKTYFIFNNKYVETEEDGGFYARNAGEYIFQCTAKDYAGREKTVQTKFNVLGNANSAFIESVDEYMPNTIINGETYVLPKLYAYEFTDGSFEKKECQLKYVVDSIEYSISDYKFVPNFDEGIDYVVIKYVYEDITKEYFYNILRVKDDDGYDIKQYFLSDDLSVEAQSTAIKLTAQEDASFTFANYLGKRNMNFTFNIDGEKNDFNKAILLLQDRVDKNVILKVEIIHDKSGEAFYSINGSKPYSTGLLFGKNEGKSFTIEYNDRIVRVCDKSSYLSDFIDFPSGEILFDFYIDGVNSESVVYFYEINNQILSDNKFDEMSPSILLDYNLNRTANLNDKIILPVAKAYDVLDGYVDVTVSVRSNGKYVYSTDGVKLQNAPANREYEIVFDSFATYNITYKSSDTSENSSPYGLPVEVIDSIQPDIKINGSVPKTGKVNSKISLPSAKATDNLSTDLVVTIVVINPDITLVDVTEDKSFTPKEKGNYTVRYYAYDEAGNLSFIEKTIIVK